MKKILISLSAASIALLSIGCNNKSSSSTPNEPSSTTQTHPVPHSNDTTSTDATTNDVEAAFESSFQTELAASTDLPVYGKWAFPEEKDGGGVTTVIMFGFTQNKWWVWYKCISADGKKELIARSALPGVKITTHSLSAEKVPDFHVSTDTNNELLSCKIDFEKSDTTEEIKYSLKNSKNTLVAVVKDGEEEQTIELERIK